MPQFLTVIEFFEYTEPHVLKLMDNPAEALKADENELIIEANRRGLPVLSTLTDAGDFLWYFPAHLLFDFYPAQP